MNQLEQEFINLLPTKFKSLNELYWSDIESIEQSCKWLSDCNNILDLGSGVGKFCLIGTQLLGSNFFGIELKSELVEFAQKLLLQYPSHSVQFNEGDLFDTNLSPYDGFYIYNPFVELISTGQKIDSSIPSDEILYNSLHERLEKKLNECPVNSLIVNNSPITDYFNHNFDLLESIDNTYLSLWKKLT